MGNRVGGFNLGSSLLLFLLFFIVGKKVLKNGGKGRGVNVKKFFFLGFFLNLFYYSCWNDLSFYNFEEIKNLVL